jgi:hypothetical protein
MSTNVTEQKTSFAAMNPVMTGVLAVAGVMVWCITGGLLGYAIGHAIGRSFAAKPFEFFGLPIKITSATLGAAVFISMAEKTLTTFHSLFEQYSKPELKRGLFDGLTIALAFAAFSFSAALFQKELTSASSVVVTPQSALLVQLPSQRPIAVLPVLFSQNAKLKANLEKRTDVSEEQDIWEGGTDKYSVQPGLVGKFLDTVVVCAHEATGEEPIVLGVRGFASSREFLDANQKVRGDSDSLNIRASNDRAKTVQTLLTDAIKQHSRPKVVLRPAQQYTSLAAMQRDRLFLDRVPGLQPLTEEEGLTRRAEILVFEAPGCSGAEALTQAKETTAGTG